MNTKKIIASVVGVVGLSALGYYAYTKSKGGASVNIPTSSLLPSGQTTSYLPGTNQATPSGFPDKSTILRIAQESGWPADIFNALNSTYNVATGTANKGDWKIQVVSVNPIKLSFRRGSEHNYLQEGRADGFKALDGLSSLLL